MLWAASHLLGTLALLQSETIAISTPMLLTIPASMIVSGVLLLVGFYFVHKRFIQVEFPGYVSRVEQRLDTLVSSTEKMEDTLLKLTILLEKHENKLDFHDWRLRQLERKNGLTGEGAGGGGT
jgi:hypothetical protein